MTAHYSGNDPAKGCGLMILVGIAVVVIIVVVVLFWLLR